MEIKSTAAALRVPDQVTGHSLSRPAAVFVLVVMLFLAVRFWKLTSFSLWGGEAVSMMSAKQPMSQFGTYARPKPLEKNIWRYFGGFWLIQQHDIDPNMDKADGSDDD